MEAVGVRLRAEHSALGLTPTPELLTHQECCSPNQIKETQLDGAGCGLFLEPTIGLPVNKP